MKLTSIIVLFSILLLAVATRPLFAAPTQTASVPIIATPPKISPCCLCIQKWTGDSEISNYRSDESCEQRSGNAPYDNCRKVEVEGNACSFVKMSGGGSSIRCAVRELYYTEKGKRKQIPTPYLNACQARTLNSIEQASRESGGGGGGGGSGGSYNYFGGGGKSSGNRASNGGGENESTCACGPDSGVANRCVATKAMNGGTYTDYRDTRGTDRDCTKTCRAIFSENSAFTDCSHFQKRND